MESEIVDQHRLRIHLRLSPRRDDKGDMVLRHRIHDTKRRLRLIHPWESSVGPFRGEVIPMHSQRYKRQYLSLGNETTGTVRRASAERLETRTAAQVWLLEESLVIEDFGIRPEHTLLEMELTVRHHDLPVCTESLVANDDRSFDIACR